MKHTYKEIWDTLSAIDVSEYQEEKMEYHTSVGVVHGGYYVKPIQKLHTASLSQKKVKMVLMR